MDFRVSGGSASAGNQLPIKLKTSVSGYRTLASVDINRWKNGKSIPQ